MTHQSPSELEHDAERVRSQIAETAEHLKDKMSPGQLMDEALHYLKGGDANQFVTNLKHQVRDNPLALALVGGGLGWLMMGSRSSGHGHATSRPAPLATHGAGTAGPSASSHQSHSAGVGSAIGKGASSVGKTAGAAAASAGHSAHSVSHSMSAGLHDARDGASEGLHRVAHSSEEMGARVKNSMLDALEREPLVLGALGLAVGAAIGAMLPTTRTEQEYMGETSAKAREAAGSALKDGVEKAKDVSHDVYAAARDEADRQGLTREGTSAADKADGVSKAAGSGLGSATERSLHQAAKPSSTTPDRAHTTGPKKM